MLPLAAVLFLAASPPASEAGFSPSAAQHTLVAGVGSAGGIVVGTAAGFLLLVGIVAAGQSACSAGCGAGEVLLVVALPLGFVAPVMLCSIGGSALAQSLVADELVGAAVAGG